MNDNVERKYDYNYQAYDPTGDTYWDASFSMALDDPDVGANASYAHLALTDVRKSLYWRSGARGKIVHLGTRGTRAGAAHRPAFDRSPTLRLHGPRDTWAGYVVHADNSLALVESLSPEGYTHKAAFKPLPDNLYVDDFLNDRGLDGGDMWLGVFIGSTGTSVSAVYDPLDDGN